MTAGAAPEPAPRKATAAEPVLTDQMIARREKLAGLRAAGIEPYPTSWPVDGYADEIIKLFEEQEAGTVADHAATGELHPDLDAERDVARTVSVAGRVMTLRGQGAVTFIDLQDSSGRIQIYVRKNDVGAEFYNTVVKGGRLLDIGDHIGVRGFVFRTRMGEVSIHAEEVVVLAKSLRPIPVAKTREVDGEQVTYDAFSDKELRYRQRDVDLVVNPEVRHAFRQRSRMVQAIRDFFNERGYLEVETPILQPLYGGASARPFITHHNALGIPLYLRIANELYLKRLIVGGFDAVYEFAKDFRNEGLDRFHNPEFTLLELYVAYQDYRWMMALVEQMIERVAMVLHGSPQVPLANPRDGHTHLDFTAPWRRVTMFDAIFERTGVQLRGLDEDAIRAAAKSLGVAVDGSMGAGKLIDEIFGEHVEPHLIQPTFITDYPLEMSPLAKPHRSEPGLVERFEAICGGKELCNAFSELNDPIDQRARFEEQARLRAKGDDEAQPIDEDFIRALEVGMPPCAGLGIGIDRLAMLMTGQESIRDVLFFPQMRPLAS